MKLIFNLLIAFLPIFIHGAIYQDKPENFNPKFEIVGSFLEWDGKILILHRQDSKAQGNTWAIPGGKIEKMETPIQASIRETYEETGFDISQEDVTYLGFVYIKYEKYDFIYHMTKCTPKEPPCSVKINFNESKGFTWVTPEQGLKMELMPDEGDCFRLIYKL